MDDATLLLLSRHLDGDLSPDETARLEDRLAREPELREELERLGEVSGWLSEMASEDEPPEALDALVAPLRIEPASRPLIRPAYRWLAAAACVVIGVAVGVEVARQHPPRAPVATTRAEHARTPSGEGAARAPFQLQPLPSVADDENLPVGAADRLLASPPSEGAVEEMKALEPVGPLEVDPDGEARREIEEKRVEPSPSRDKETSVVVADATAAASPVAAGRADERMAVAAPGPSKAAVAPPSPATMRNRAGKEEAVWSGLGADRAGTATLELWAPAGVRSALAPVGDLIPPGRYRVVVQIDDTGRVVGLERATGDGGLPTEAVAALLGLVFEGVAAGAHDGVLSVPSRLPAPPTPGE